MAFEADQFLDRRRLKRGLTFWRIVAVLAVAAAAIAVVGRFDWSGRWNHVARLSVDGIILQDPDREEALAELARDSRAKALIVRIDSPGGTFVGGETLYKSLREIAKAMPVVAVMGGTATSAGYMGAIAGDHIVAREGSLTGSIGVILQTADVTGLLDKIGIKPESIKSGPNKAQPNPLEPFTPAAREAIEDVVKDLFQMFVDLVGERRKLPRDQVLKLADGRVFTGRQALSNGLVDAIGGEQEARLWLEKTHQVDASLPVRDVEIRHKGEFWRDMLTGLVGKALLSERLRLDGVISLWHPDLR